MKKLILWIGMLGAVFALDFGSMGNTSAGLGNSGVALRKSAWGIYYNPALLASDNRWKFAYSFDANIKGTQLFSPLEVLFGTQKLPSMISSQNGIVLQITGGTREVAEISENGRKTGKMFEQRSPNGSVAIGSFVSFVANARLSLSGGVDGISLFEIPVAWGWRFETHQGDISVGIGLRYMRMANMEHINFKNILDNIFSGPDLKDSLGVDLGILYTPISSLHLGVVAKNINTPTFDFKSRRIKIDPQFRFGVSYDITDQLLVTFDADLAPNSSLFADHPATQTIGGGLLFDIGQFDFRIGLMTDIANAQYGPLITGGLNLFGFLDLAVQSNFKLTDIEGIKLPEALTIKLGGSFTF